MEQPCFKLSSGFSMPCLGAGTALSDRKTKSEIAVAAFRTVLEIGYRHIDCAEIYASEEHVGVALQEQFSKGNLKREDVFITTKLWMTEMSPESVKPACLGSLKRLGLDYLDLYLIHWPMAIKRSLNGGLSPVADSDGFAVALDVDYVDTWKEMQKLVKDGLVRSIGVSSFNKRQLERVLACAEIPPAVNQIECHPYLQQNKLIEFCKEKNIVVTASSPLGNKHLASATELKVILDEPVIKEIAEKHQKTPAQVIIRFLLQKGISVIPFSMNADHMESNFRVFYFELDNEDLQRLAALDQGLRIIPMAGKSTEYFGIPSFANHPHYPFKDDY